MNVKKILEEDARRELLRREQEEAALRHLLAALDAPTSFCAECARGVTGSKSRPQNHFHHHDDRANHALLLIEAAAPAIRRLLAEKKS